MSLCVVQKRCQIYHAERNGGLVLPSRDLVDFVNFVLEVRGTFKSAALLGVEKASVPEVLAN